MSRVRGHVFRVVEAKKIVVHWLDTNQSVLMVKRAALVLSRCVSSRRATTNSLLSQMHANALHSRTPDAFVCVLNPTSLDKPHKVGELDVGSLWASARTASARKTLESRVVYGQGEEVAALVSVGTDVAKKPLETRREVVRKAAGKGMGLLRELAAEGNAAAVKEVGVDLVGTDGDWHAAGTKFCFSFS